MALPASDGVWTKLRRSPIRCWTFGQTGTLADQIDCPLPARLGLFHSLQCGLGDLCGNVLLIPFPLLDDRVYSLARTRQRFRCLEVGNRLSRGLTALAVFVIAGKIGVAIDLVHLRVGSSHPLTRLVGGLVQA